MLLNDFCCHGQVARRLHTKTPTRPLVEDEEEAGAAAASSDMVKKKELSAQPRQLALRTTSTHANSTLSFVQASMSFGSFKLAFFNGFMCSKV
jgi:hypothetical protein